MAASAETIRECIKHRLGFERKMGLVIKYGLDKVLSALDDTAYLYESHQLEEIGSSDVSYMCESFYHALGEPWEWGGKS